MSSDDAFVTTQSNINETNLDSAREDKLAADSEATGQVSQRKSASSQTIDQNPLLTYQRKSKDSKTPSVGVKSWTTPRATRELRTRTPKPCRRRKSWTRRWTLWNRRCVVLSRELYNV